VLGRGYAAVDFRETRLAEVQRTRSGEDKGGRTVVCDPRNRCVELAAGVQVYSDPASTLRTMAHNHSASQDVVLTAIQQSSGKPQSPTLMDLDIQDRGYQLRRIPLPRTWVNKGEKRGRRPSLGGIIEVHRDIEQGVRSYDPPT